MKDDASVPDDPDESESADQGERSDEGERDANSTRATDHDPNTDRMQEIDRESTDSQERTDIDREQTNDRESTGSQERTDTDREQANDRESTGSQERTDEQELDEGRRAAADRNPGSETEVSADIHPPETDDQPQREDGTPEPTLQTDETTSDAHPGDDEETEDLPEDVREYRRFSKIDGGTYERTNEFLRDRTYITAREWAIARLCADFRTETGVEMTKIGENLPHLVPFMTDTYSPQAVNQARASFEEKVRKAGATFLYGAMCDFFTAEELDHLMYEITEVAKFLLEVEGVELSVDEELEAEDRISNVMREVRESSVALRHDSVTCPNCGHETNVSGSERDTSATADGGSDEPVAR